eukprot:7661477-Prorocentrum_lima.AAC.1
MGTWDVLLLQEVTPNAASDIDSVSAYSWYWAEDLQTTVAIHGKWEAHVSQVITGLKHVMVTVQRGQQLLHLLSAHMYHR